MKLNQTFPPQEVKNSKGKNHPTKTANAKAKAKSPSKPNSSAKAKSSNKPGTAKPVEKNAQELSYEERRAAAYGISPEKLKFLDETFPKTGLPKTDSFETIDVKVSKDMMRTLRSPFLRDAFGVIKDDGNLPVSNPMSIKIRNLTDEKLYNVKVFDYKHSFQRKLEYTPLTPGLEYDDILRQLAAENECRIIIGMTALTVAYFGKLDHVEKRQINSQMTIKYKTMFGIVAEQPMNIFMDAYQQQPDTIIGRKSYGLDNSLSLELEYLLPNTEVIISMYPSSIMYVTHEMRRAIEQKEKEEMGKRILPQ